MGINWHHVPSYVVNAHSICDKMHNQKHEETIKIIQIKEHFWNSCHVLFRVLSLRTKRNCSELKKTEWRDVTMECNGWLGTGRLLEDGIKTFVTIRTDCVFNDTPILKSPEFDLVWLCNRMPISLGDTN